MSPEASKLRVSVCICTRNRPDALRVALESLAESSVPVWETIVADDSTDDLTVTMMTRDFPRVKYVRGARLGLGANRNRAASVVEGTHILFLDDDAALAPDFISTMRPFAEPASAERLILSGGERTRGEEIYPRDMGFLGYLDRPRAADAVTPLQTSVMNATLFPAALLRLIGFDENLIYGWDEIDFSHRAARLGYSFQLVPAAINEHFSSPLHRDDYFVHRDSSRLYATFKMYLFTQRSRGKAALYAVVAPAHLFAHALKRSGLRGVGEASLALTTASSFLSRYLHQRTDLPPLRNRVTIAASREDSAA